MMTCFGLAFILVQWHRLKIGYRIARLGFLVLLFVICGLPMIFVMVLSGPKSSLRWPPYAPPYIAVIHEWMQPNEVTASDMPWAIAWYADRRSIWLPENRRHFYRA